MSNLTMLLTSKGPTKPRFDQRDGEHIRAAMSIPVFWYSLFDASCPTLGPSPEDPPRKYLHLTTPTDDGLARAESRWPMLATVIGRQLKALFRAWLGYLREHAADYFHIETMEWWWMFDSDKKFKAELLTCLSAFDHPPTRAKGKVRLHRSWQRMLGQAHVGTRRGALDPLGNNSYCGFGGDGTPWSGDENWVCGSMSEAIRKRIAVGREPNELLPYLENVWGPIQESRLVSCLCGGLAFRVRIRKDNGGAERHCVSCDRTQFVLNSGDYWLEEGAKKWACAGCRTRVANLAMGAESDSNGERMLFVRLAARCVKCGRMANVTGWEEGIPFAELDDLCNIAYRLLHDGDDLLQGGKHEKALVQLERAWAELPEPRDKQPPAAEIQYSLADCYRGLNRWQECLGAIRDVIRIEGETSLGSRLRMGIALFELDELAEARTQLAAILTSKGGKRLFVAEDPKYLAFVRSRPTD